MIYELDIYRLLTASPELIQEGLEIHDYKHIIKFGNNRFFEIDLLGEDKEGNLIPIEVKITKEGGGFGQVYEYVRSMKSKYGILAIINPENLLSSKFEQVKYSPIYISDIELVSTFNIKLFKKDDIKTFETVEQSSATNLRNRIKLAKEKNGDNSMLKTTGDDLRHIDNVSYWLRNNGTCYGKSNETNSEEKEERIRVMRCMNCGKEMFRIPINYEAFVFCSSDCVRKFIKSEGDLISRYG